MAEPMLANWCAASATESGAAMTYDTLTSTP